MVASTAARTHGRWLWRLLALFAARVVAQPLVVLAIAAGYGTVMAGRLVLGATAYRGHWWLDAPLPTLFHLVLTTFLVVYGHYHWRAHPLDAPSS